MQVGDIAMTQFTIFQADGTMPWSGQAGSVTDALFLNGATSAQPVTVAEIGVTGTYEATFTANAAGDWMLRLTNPDGRVRAAEWHVEINDNDSLAADIATVQADTDDIQTRLPAALVSGRMDSDVGAMQAGVVDATAIATDAVNADALAADAVTEIQAAILSDATPFAGADIDAAITSRATPLDVTTARDAIITELKRENIAVETTVNAVSTPTSIKTGLTQANDFFNNMQVVVINAAGVAVRNIDDYVQTAGEIIVTALPFTPVVTDPVLVLARTGSVPVDLTPITSKLPTNYIMGSSDQDDHDTDIDTLVARLTAGRANNLDEITAVRLAELDAANIPADVDAIKAQTDQLAFTGNDVHATLDGETVDVGAISGDAGAADNLEATYDGTGYEDPVAPAQQQQLAQIALTGAAINAPANADTTLTTGTVIAGDYTETAELDGVYWQIADDTGTIDLYFEFLIPADGVPTTVTHTGRMMGLGDDLLVYAWNWGASAWEAVGSLAGQSGSSDSARTYNLFTAHVGTGVNLGKVRVRFIGVGLTSADFYTDQIFLSYAVIYRSVGYADGAIWIDTIGGTAGTTPYYNGTADNPVDSLADATTLATSLGLKRFQIAPGSSITLASAYVGFVFRGTMWAMNLGGQDVSNSSFIGADLGTVTGAATGTDPRFVGCSIGMMVLPTSSVLEDCSLEADITLSGLDTDIVTFINCRLGTTKIGLVNIDMSGDGPALAMRPYTGGVRIINKSGASKVAIDFISGRVELASSITAGTFYIRGVGEITANDATGIDLYDDPLINPAVIEVLLASIHGSGLWDAVSAGLTQQQVRDAMKLAPTAGAPDAGSVDLHLDDIETDTAAIDGRLPNDPADESLQQAAHAATQSDIAALENLSQAQAQAAAAAALTAYDPPTKGELDLVEASLVAEHDDTQAAIAALPATIDDLLSDEHGDGSWEAVSALTVHTVKQTYVYNRAADELRGLVWLESAGQLVVNPTSVSVEIKDADDNLLFTMTDASPDSTGAFKVVRSAPGLGSGRVLKAVASMSTPAFGTLTSSFGMFTLGG